MSGDAPTRLEQQLRSSLARLGLSPDQQPTKEVPPVTDQLAVRTLEPTNRSLFAITSFTEAMTLATTLAKTEFVPSSYRGKPEAVLAAIMMGAELAIGPLQALQGIAVINGRPCVFGDLALALCQRHPDFVDCIETFNAQTMTATCTVKRKGFQDITRTFSWADAQRAKLTSKDTYQSYPQRMLPMRARSWALRDRMSDVLRGLQIVEEVRDYVQVDGTVVMQDTAVLHKPEDASIREPAQLSNVKQIDTEVYQPAAPPPPAAAPRRAAPVIELVTTPQSLSDFMVPSGTNAGKRMRDLKDSTLEWYATQCKDPQIMGAATFERTRREKLLRDADRVEHIDAHGVVTNNNGAAE